MSYSTETASVSGAKTIATSSYDFFEFTLTGNVTFTHSGTGKTWMVMTKQDGTGGRTITWDTILWDAGVMPSPSSAAGARDSYVFVRESGGSIRGWQSGKGHA